jgi:hypothetical protein
MAGVAKHLKGFPRHYAAGRVGPTVVNVIASSPPRARAVICFYFLTHFIFKK